MASGCADRLWEIARRETDQNIRDLVGAVGIEPTTFGLKGRCSTTELRPYGVNPQL